MMWTDWSPRLSPGLLLLKKDNRKPVLYPRPLTSGLRRWSLGEEEEQNQKLEASLAHLKQNPVSKQTNEKEGKIHSTMGTDEKCRTLGSELTYLYDQG